MLEGDKTGYVQILQFRAPVFRSVYEGRVEGDEQGVIVAKGRKDKENRPKAPTLRYICVTRTERYRACTTVRPR